MRLIVTCGAEACRSLSSAAGGLRKAAPETVLTEQASPADRDTRSVRAPGGFPTIIMAPPEHRGRDIAIAALLLRLVQHP